MRKRAVCSEMIPEEARERLERYAERIIVLPPHPSLPQPVASHADMIMTVLGKTAFIDKVYYEAYPETVSSLEEAGLDIAVSRSEVGAEYPNDAALNILTGDGFAAGHYSFADRAVVEAATRSGGTFFGVRQGYAACSCLLAGDLLITADKGIAKMLSARCEVLQICQGHISLPPFDTGFIGGASGFDGERVYFVGDPSTHPDGERITLAILSRGYETVSLIPGELYDIGGIKFF